MRTSHAKPAGLLLLALILTYCGSGCVITKKHEAHGQVEIRHIQESTADMLDYIEGHTDTLPENTEKYMFSEHTELANNSRPQDTSDSSSPPPGADTVPKSSQRDSLATTKITVESVPAGAVVLMAPARNGKYLPWKSGDRELTTPVRDMGPALRECWVKVRKGGFEEPAPKRVGLDSVPPIRLKFELKPLAEKLPQADNESS